MLGLGQLSLNWTTGDLDYRIARVQMLGSAYLKQGLYAPWILSVSVPLGAIVFLIRRNKLRVGEKEPLAETGLENIVVGDPAVPDVAMEQPPSPAAPGSEADDHVKPPVVP